MKILFIDQFSEMGGAQRGLIATVDAALKRGWKASAALPGNGPVIGHLRSRGVVTAMIPCGPYQSGRKSARDSLRFGFDVIGQIQAITDVSNSNAFDLIYVNGPRIMPAVAIGVRQRIPVLFHAHSHLFQVARRLSTWSIRATNAAVVACSDSVMEDLRQNAITDKQYVLPNGVDDLGFRARQFGGKRWRIGMVGRISPEKGQVEFLKAAALIAQKFAEVEFIVCGAPLFADPRYLNTVQGLADRLPVEFLGWRDDVASVFAELDLLIVPSKQEGMGRVVVEAFSAGVPVVAFPVGGITELIRDEETGFLVRPETAEGLAARIGEVLSAAPELLTKVAARARLKWECEYRLDLYQERIIAFVERLIRDERAKRGNRTLQAHR